METTLVGTMQHDGEILTINRTQYASGGLAIVIKDADGEPYATLSTNLQGLVLEPDEFAVKTWSENAGVARAAARSGYFADTGRTAQAGHATAEIWLLANAESSSQ